MAIKVDPEWWKKIFDGVYLLTDSRSVCDEEITRREVDLICQLLPIDPAHKILDLCGGHGRHSIELCARGFRNCTLLDYSEHLIRHAMARAAEHNCPIEFIQVDARDTGLPANHFDHVIIMGNSLGYLPDPDADRQILAEVYRVLRPQGWIMIDVVDGAEVRESFNPSSWHEIGNDIVVCRLREIQEQMVFAREVVLSKEKGLIRDHTYSIRLYDLKAMKSLLNQAGFSDLNARTQSSLKAGSEDCGFMSMRMIVTGRKTSRRTGEVQ